jgi:AraC-like DNA-binding protein
MAWSAFHRFTDPQAFEPAVQGAAVEVFPTAKGRFETEITKVRFDQLWMQRFHTILPQVDTVAHKQDRRAISFLTEPKSPTWMHCGIKVLPGDIIAGRREMIYERLDGDVRSGAMSLPTHELNAALKAIAGRELPEKQKSIVRPDPALMSRLLTLHRVVGQLPHDTPQILELPEVGRAIEAQLIHVMVHCLAESMAVPITTGIHRYDSIMSRFEELEKNLDRPLYLTEICAGISVAERTLRAACEEHLGMGPICFLTLRRMHLTRRALLGSDASKATITRIATDHGFWELGRFAVAYRTLFQETPSETLRRPAERTGFELNRPSSLAGSG